MSLGGIVFAVFPLLIYCHFLMIKVKHSNTEVKDIKTKVKILAGFKKLGIKSSIIQGII